jgi:hypothetical protein
MERGLRRPLKHSYQASKEQVLRLIVKALLARLINHVTLLRPLVGINMQLTK